MSESSAGNESTVSAVDPLAGELLRSVVEVARAIFGAEASSVFLLDEAAHELVFQAVSGRGEAFLVGRRFPADSGIAGWVVTSGEPMIVADLSRSAAFDRDFAKSTEFVPDALMAAPLIHGDRVLGVLEVLDPAPQARSSLGELDLLALFARQAATALRLADDRRGTARPADPRPSPDLAEGPRSRALDLLEDLRSVLQSPV
ncbi:MULTISPECIES: GAF domain-containing protein [unclassified Streptomyces]|uniref:GAF domain-containing protein n=1 Tax=unclassified Streptomyces TaxID=2593676 RepID=UPI003432E2D9|nr:GAF domain-containing protein [Streptomyces sp. NBC_00872]